MGGTGERDELVDRFSTLPGHVRSAAHAAEGQAVPAGEWGPAEIVRHLIAVEDEVWRGRLASVAAEDEPHWAWTEPGLAPGFDDVPLDDVIAAFTDARAGTVEIVRALDESGWARAGIHATYGRLDIAGLLRLATDHDAEHLASIAPVPQADRA